MSYQVLSVGRHWRSIWHPMGSTHSNFLGIAKPVIIIVRIIGILDPVAVEIVLHL